MKRQAFIFFILLFVVAASFAQELRLFVSNQPLNAVLNTLNIEISFDDKALSNYKVTVSKTFTSPEDALNYLLIDKPFKVEKIGNVFVISPVLIIESKPEIVVTEKKYILTGELYDITTGEPLPYVNIQTVKGITTTNELGMFSIVQTNSQPVWIKVHYLGFETIDTVLNTGKHRIMLLPKSITLDEVIVSMSPAVMMMQVSKTSGEISINSQVARYLPGNADNSVFTLLNMLPGVRASGEPSDLIVWGSNWSESRLRFDGITIYGMKSFNDQIGAVNPFITKNIRLLKGGYDSSHGNRIGAIAEVTGNEGNLDKMAVKASISNYTANIFASMPVKKSSVLSVAYRQTFYNLYNGSGFGIGNSEDSLRTFISPNYSFRDLFLKFTGRTSGNSRYYISFYGAEDYFKKLKNAENLSERNRQYGAAAAYNRLWNNGNTIKLLLSFSKLMITTDNVFGKYDNAPAILYKYHIDNSIQELSLKVEHYFNLGERHKVQIGCDLQQFVCLLNSEQNQIYDPSIYITDNMMFGRLSLQAGVRADWIPDDKIYVQPRISARYSISEELTATASFGLYNQCLALTPSSGYTVTVWKLQNNMFLTSTHLLTGFAYSNAGWLFSVEGYYKQKKNYNIVYYSNNKIYTPLNNIYGADIYLKKEWRKQTFFGSYSLVNSRMPHKSVGHEIKSGAIVSLNSFHLSSTLIYGAGFPAMTIREMETNKDFDISEPYCRLDMSLVYRLQLKKCKIQTGVSLLNVLNTNNIAYSYRTEDQGNFFNLYTKATPRTGILFFEVNF